MNDIDRLRSEALSRADRAERWFRITLYGAALVEALCVAAFFAVANLHDPLHRALFFAVAIIYEPIVLGLIALGAYVNRCTLRVLVRIDAIDR